MFRALSRASAAESNIHIFGFSLRHLSYIVQLTFQPAPWTRYSRIRRSSPKAMIRSHTVVERVYNLTFRKRISCLSEYSVLLLIMSIAESFTLLSLALCVISVRSWYRWSLVGFAGFQLDDYLVLFSDVCRPNITICCSRASRESACTLYLFKLLLFALISAIACLVGTNYQRLPNSYMMETERAVLKLNSAEAYNRVMGFKTEVIGSPIP